MLCSKILVAFDNSDLAVKALEKAINIAESDPKIEIHVVHVVQIPVPIRPEMVHLITSDEVITQHSKDMMGKVDLTLAKLPNHTEVHILKGISPAYVLLDYSEEQNCDLIAMGSRGLSGIKEFLGSVSHTVVQQSSVPLLITK